MATYDVAVDPNELGGAGAAMTEVLTIPSDPVAGQVYPASPYTLRYEGAGAWSAQGYDRSGNAVWVPVTAHARGAVAIGGPSGGPEPTAPGGGLDLAALARNPLVVGAAAVAAILLLGRR